MRNNDHICLAYDFWITTFTSDTIQIAIDVNKDLKRAATLLRCIPELEIYPSWMDFKIPEEKFLRDGITFYRVTIPPDFYTSGGRYFNKGVRETIPYFAKLKGEFERDEPMNGKLNLRMPGKLINGRVDRIFMFDNDGIVYLDDTELVEDRKDVQVVFIEPKTLIEYKLPLTLLI